MTFFFRKTALLFLCSGVILNAGTAHATTEESNETPPVCVSVLTKAQWQKLDTVPFKGKQDDIFFVNTETGWYVNGQGFIYKTVDGGKTWTEQTHRPGTYFRALGFIDEKNGFAGNIGPDSFPNVTDTTPLYRTQDGGVTWSPVTEISPQQLKGVCSIDILKTQFINAGNLETRVTVRAAGRVGGPAMMATSRDGGKTWKTEDLSSVTSMILDVKFVNEQTGFLAGASHSDIAQAHAQVLKTTDGGTTWKVVYESNRPFETTWKVSFPTEKTGYTTIQNYDQDAANEQRFVAKSVDGGKTWTEIPLVKDHTVREFGIGFVDEKIGWVGAINGGWLTTDGGQTWSHQPMGTAVNKIRVISSPTGYVVYAIGVDVRKLDLRTP